MLNLHIICLWKGCRIVLVKQKNLILLLTKAIRQQQLKFNYNMWRTIICLEHFLKCLAPWALLFRLISYCLFFFSFSMCYFRYRLRLAISLMKIQAGGCPDISGLSGFCARGEQREAFPFSSNYVQPSCFAWPFRQSFAFGFSASRCAAPHTVHLQLTAQS